jgi:hypothetical protein
MNVPVLAHEAPKIFQKKLLTDDAVILNIRKISIF